jgi:ATP-binding cassette subfamily C protein
VKFLLVFARSDPWRSLIILLCLVLAGAAEGVGLATLLPFLGLSAQTTTGADGAPPRAPEGFERTVTETITGLGLEPTLGVMLCAVVIAVAVKSILVLLAKAQVGYAVAQVATDMRMRLIRALLATRWAYYTRQPVGGVANAFATEAQRTSRAFLSGTSMLSQLIGLVVYASVALATSWQMTLAAIPIGLVTVLLLNQLVLITRKAGRQETGLLKGVIGHLTDVLQGVRPLKAMAREGLVFPLLVRDTENLNRAMRRQVLSKEAVLTLQEGLLMTYVAGGIYVAVAWFEMEVGAVFLLALLFIRALTAMNKSQRQYQAMVSNESAYWSMAEMVERAEAEREQWPGQREPELASGIELREVEFRYGDHPVLDGISLSMPAGQVTAVIGPSGTGKTTLVDLLTGLASPERGAIFVDGIELSELDLGAWRRRIGYVPQELFLLHQSVAVNVALDDPEVTRPDIERALRLAGAWEFVSRMPEGMDSFVGERGSQLSGGQRQLISIARALVRRPKLLILDEATASLDRASELAVWDRIDKLRGEVTVLAVSHQTGVLDIADRIYRIEGGRALDQPPGRGEAAAAPGPA